MAMKNDKSSSKQQYETFDSGGGPVIPKGHESDFDNKDSNLGADGAAGQDKDLGVPYMPMK